MFDFGFGYTEMFVVALVAIIVIGPKDLPRVLRAFGKTVGKMRGMARERHMRGVGMAPPFTLTLWKNGTLSLEDKATGRSIEIGSFGPDNRAAFAALLPGGAN